MKIKEVIISDEEKQYIFQDNTGNAEMHVHKVFNGIEMVYNSIHMDKCSIGTSEEGRIIEIQHCQEGRIEHDFGDNFFYLMPGDLVVTIRSKQPKTFNFPMRRYHGITIIINPEIAPKCFSCFLKDVNVNPLNVATRLCGDKCCFIIRNEKYIEHIFSELYSVPNSYKKGYIKIKILELLLVLSGVDPKENRMRSVSLSKKQVSLAKEISAYLQERIDRNITVKDLAEKFHISKSHLQNIFKCVYGTSVFNYMRIQKIQSAALKLIHTELSILEIANECSYDNASKFAAAFREIMGQTPGEYRKTHTTL